LDLIPAAIAPLAALVAYLPAIVVPYAFMDDYYLLAWQRGLEGELWKTATEFGRPLHALFLSGAFSLAPDIASVRIVRLLGLLGVMVLVVFLHYVLRHAGFGKWLATGICVSVVSLASFQIYVFLGGGLRDSVCSASRRNGSSMRVSRSFYRNFLPGRRLLTRRGGRGSSREPSRRSRRRLG
jgi:hypothetical protein